MARPDQGDRSGQGNRHEAVTRWGLAALAVLGIALAVVQVWAMVSESGGLSRINEIADAVLKCLGFSAAAFLLITVGSSIRLKFGDKELELKGLSSTDKETIRLINEANNEIANLKREVARVNEWPGVNLLNVGPVPPRLPTFSAPAALPLGDPFIDLPAQSPRPDDVRPPVPARIDMPALHNPSVKDDRQKGRFGGSHLRDGFELSAAFSLTGSPDLVSVELTVARTDKDHLRNIVHFFLHESFSEEQVTVEPHDGKAQLKLVIWGGFTVGAWVEGTGTLLELDLAMLKDAPDIVKHR